MADYAIPTLAVTGPDIGTYFNLSANTQAFVSPLGGQMQTSEIPGSRWVAGLTWLRLSSSDAAAYAGWLVSLRGQANRALIPRYERLTPRGTIAGTPIVQGSGQTGTSFVIQGLTAGTTLLASDCIGIAQGLSTAQILMITAAASASGGGVMSLQVFPEVRSAPSSGSTIVLSGPKARFILADKNVRWSPQIFGQIDFANDFIEAFS